jgi:sec-independent protein translocase protein TatA
MSIGFGQILLILIVVFVLFGAGKLPSVMADLAKGIRAFKKGLAEEEETETLALAIPEAPRTGHSQSQQTEQQAKDV